jgi:hypothetical protein
MCPNAVAIRANLVVLGNLLSEPAPRVGANEGIDITGLISIFAVIKFHDVGSKNCAPIRTEDIFLLICEAKS